MRFDKHAKWRKVPHWIDKHFRIRVREYPDLAQDYKGSMNTLTRVQMWYNTLYSYEKHNYLANLPIHIPLKDHHLFADKIDILSTSLDGFTIHDFVEIKEEWRAARLATYARLREDLVAAARVWGFMVATDQVPYAYTRLCITPRGVFPLRKLLDDETMSWIRRTIPYILKGISRGVYYPVISGQCGQCPHAARCLT